MQLDWFNIYYGELDYNNGGSDDRPVLIIETKLNKENVQCLKITRLVHKNNYNNYIEISDLKSAGLKEPSILDLDEVYIVDRTKIRRYAGKLSFNDLNTLIAKLEEISGIDSIRQNTQFRKVESLLKFKLVEGIYKSKEKLYNKNMNIDYTDKLSNIKVIGQYSINENIQYLARSIAKDFKRAGKIDFRGTEINTARDLAELFVIYRDPRYETQRVVFVKDNKIVSVQGVSSHIPGYSSYIRRSSASRTLKDEKIKMFIDYRHLMERTSANGYYLFHNHPSGNVSFSNADLYVDSVFKGNLNGYLGSIVIGDDKANILTTSGDSTIIDIKGEPLKITTGILGLQFNGNAKNIAQQYKDYNTVVVFLTQMNKVSAIASIDDKDFNNNEIYNRLDNEGVSNGSNRIVIITTNKVLFTKLLSHVESGDLIDAIYYDENQNSVQSSFSNTSLVNNTNRITDKADKNRYNEIYHIEENPCNYLGLKFNLKENLLKTDNQDKILKQGFKKYAYHVTFASNLNNIFTKGLTNFWFGNDYAECIDYVLYNHKEVDDNIVIIEIDKKLLKPNLCDFEIDAGDGVSNIWTGTGIYTGTITKFHNIYDIDGEEISDSELYKHIKGKSIIDLPKSESLNTTIYKNKKDYYNLESFNNGFKFKLVEDDVTPGTLLKPAEDAYNYILSKYPPKDSFSNTQSILINKNGKFIGGEHGTHTSILDELVAGEFIKDWDVWESTLADIGFVRASFGVDDGFDYIELPDDITNAQIYAIEKLLPYFSSEYLTIYADEGNQVIDDIPNSTDFNKIINIIKRYQSIGKLEHNYFGERLNETKTVEYDNEGNVLSPEQSEYFKNSKIRDESGHLLVCYHGSMSKFDTFDKSKARVGYGGNRSRPGFFFTINKRYNNVTSYYSDGDKSRVKACYLNIKNPFIAHAPNGVEEYEKGMTSANDGVISVWGEKENWTSSYYNYFNDELEIEDIKTNDILEIVAFDENQIKSITNKNPTNSNHINEGLNFKLVEDVNETALISNLRDVGFNNYFEPVVEIEDKWDVGEDIVAEYWDRDEDGAEVNVAHLAVRVYHETNRKGICFREIWVSKDYQGQGIAAQLVEACLLAIDKDKDIVLVHLDFSGGFWSHMKKEFPDYNWDKTIKDESLSTGLSFRLVEDLSDKELYK